MIKVANFWGEQGKKIQEHQPTMAHSLQKSLDKPEADSDKGGGEEFFSGDDPLFDQVKQIVLETQKASASFLQRRLRIGYSRAARLIDMLEECGIVGPADGAKPREVYGDAGDATRANLIPSGGLDESEETKKDSGPWQKI